MTAALILALHLSVTNGVARVGFDPPPSGWWIVWSYNAAKPFDWHAVGSGPGGGHAVVPDKCVGACQVYRVEWRPGKVAPR